MPVRRIALVVALTMSLVACSEPTSSDDTSEIAQPATTAVESAPTTPSTTSTTSATPDATTTTTILGGEPDPTLLYTNYVRSETYADGLELDIHAPAEIGPWPVVVMVHGGGWFVGDRGSMGPLADGLASRKAVVFNATYRTLALGGTFPGMVDDVACAVQFARNAAAEFTSTPDVVTLVGHSAGAHLSSLITYAPGEFGQDCPEGPSRAPDAFVGLAGPYDISQLGGILTPLFGVPIADDPELWASGSPFSWIGDSPDVPTLLLHGDADRVAPIEFSEELAEALAEADRDVTFEALQGRDHSDVNAPRVVADRIATFLTGLDSP